MRIIHKLKIKTALIALLGATLVSVTPAADEKVSAAPFVCSSTFYQVIQGNLHSLDTIDGSYNQIGTSGSIAINAIGYNTEDNYIYGIRGQTGPIYTLIRFEDDGTFTDLGTPVGLADVAYNAGDFDDSGNLWVAAQGGANTIYQIDVSTNTVINSYPNIPIGADLVFVGGHLYTVHNVLGLINIDLADGTYTVSTVTDLPPGQPSGYGAGWSTSEGNLYVSLNSSGQIYQIADYDTLAPSATPVLQGQVTFSNDGASCINSASPIPPAIDAVNDDFTSTPTEPGEQAGNVFTNDTANSESVADRPEDFTVDVTDDGGLTGVTIDADGNIIVPSDAEPGTYSVTYQLCQAANSTNCDTAVISLVVSAVSATPGGDDTPSAPDAGVSNQVEINLSLILLAASILTVLGLAAYGKRLLSALHF